MRGALRELWLIAATWDVELVVRHRPGVELVIPDMLSRVTISEAADQKVANFAGLAVEKERKVHWAALMPPLPLRTQSPRVLCNLYVLLYSSKLASDG